MNTCKSAGRKPYAAPTLVRHGDAVERTRGGYWGIFSEFYGVRWTYDHPTLPDGPAVKN